MALEACADCAQTIADLRAVLAAADERVLAQNGGNEGDAARHVTGAMLTLAIARMMRSTECNGDPFRVIVAFTKLLGTLVDACDDNEDEPPAKPVQELTLADLERMKLGKA